MGEERGEPLSCKERVLRRGSGRHFGWAGSGVAVAARGALRVFPRQPLGEGDADGGEDEGEVDHGDHRDDLDVFKAQAAAEVRLQRMDA